MKYCHNKKDIPTTPHYAVLVEKSVTTPGYDAGDPNDSVDVWDYLVFDDKDEWEKWIQNESMPRSYGRGEQFIPIYAVPASITVNVSVTTKL